MNLLPNSKTFTAVLVIIPFSVIRNFLGVHGSLYAGKSAEKYKNGFFPLLSSLEIL
jgi:hypothetical protein